ncbi:MAG: class I SAM-dependent methyltransferase [Myxococcota bacterium]|nr:class I SAM-dependent methyltransferase [Myxococcota bacterium]
MDELRRGDVPYGNDWDSPEEVADWTAAADRLRPWRARIRDHVADRVAALPPGARVLELGSGPGLLAHRVLERCPELERYVLLDFSPPMLAASRERLAGFPAASFVLGSFKSEGWTDRVGGPFDCVLSMQAVHELRHKRHALRLYEQAHGILAVPGRVMICDHTPFDASPTSTALYMTEEEQRETLAAAGFTAIRVELRIDSLVLYVGERAG